MKAGNRLRESISYFHPVLLRTENSIFWGYSLDGLKRLPVTQEIMRSSRIIPVQSRAVLRLAIRFRLRLKTKKDCNFSECSAAG